MAYNLFADCHDGSYSGTSAVMAWMDGATGPGRWLELGPSTRSVEPYSHMIIHHNLYDILYVIYT